MSKLILTAENKMLPTNLLTLHCAEEELRQKAFEALAADDLSKHLVALEAVMNMADAFRQWNATDEDLKTIQFLAMRMFNAFAASLKLLLSGYSQVAVLILRDVLETAFLLNLFVGNRRAISEWRLADAKTIRKKFSPVEVRKALDDRDGFREKNREKRYKMFSELAAHPSMQSTHMMRPQEHPDILSGPFMDPGTLRAVMAEMGLLAIEVGEQLQFFLPPVQQKLSQDFGKVKLDWISTFLNIPMRK